MPALIQDAFLGNLSAAPVTWPGGVGVAGGRIPLRGGGAPNMSGITEGSVRKARLSLNAQFRANEAARAKATEQWTTANLNKEKPQGNGTYFGDYMQHPNLMKLKVGGARKHRRRPTRKSRRVQRKSRRVQRKSRLTRRR